LKIALDLTTKSLIESQARSHVSMLHTYLFKGEAKDYSLVLFAFETGEVWSMTHGF